MKTQREKIAIQICQAIMQEHSKSFSFAAYLFPKSLRQDVAVLYAWCRRADDAVDEKPIDEAKTALTELIQELDEVYQAKKSSRVQDNDILYAFRSLVHRKKIPKTYPRELLRGMEMDLVHMRYHHLDQLYLYCYRVAGVVGLMMCHLMGIKEDAALKNAVHLGIGMQLTNICRDVSEDWGRGRLYLPDSLLPLDPNHLQTLHDTYQTHSLQQATVRFTQSLIPNQFQLATQQATLSLLSYAHIHYDLGHQGIVALPWRIGLAIQAASVIYSVIGRIVNQRSGDPNQKRACTTLFRKLRLLGRVLCLRVIDLSLIKSLWHSSSFKTPNIKILFADISHDLHALHDTSVKS